MRLCVIGAGGDRDRGKRPLMGAAAVAADLVIVTDDNPRTEDPAAIVSKIQDGVRRTDSREQSADDLARADRGYHTQIDRRQAIREGRRQDGVEVQGRHVRGERTSGPGLRRLRAGVV